MSKWNQEMDEKLRTMCMDEISNAEIAEALQMPLSDIHARRSYLGITRDKIAAIKDGKTDFVNKIRCACCGSNKANELYTMPNGEDKTFCRRCAMVADYINSH